MWHKSKSCGISREDSILSVVLNQGKYASSACSMKSKHRHLKQNSVIIILVSLYPFFKWLTSWGCSLCLWKHIWLCLTMIPLECALWINLCFLMGDWGRLAMLNKLLLALHSRLWTQLTVADFTSTFRLACTRAVYTECIIFRQLFCLIRYLISSLIIWIFL